MAIVKVATKKSVKLIAIEKSFKRYFDHIILTPFKVKSRVPRQPVNNDVFSGAENRLQELKKVCGKNYDFLVSCESGLLCLHGYWFNVQIVIVEDKKGNRGVGISQGYQIPEQYIQEIISTSLARTMDRLFDGKGGIRYLTKFQFTREDLIRDATTMALTRVLNGDIW